MHGLVHYSYCVYCPDFTAKEAIENKRGRKLSHCLLAHSFDLGKISDQGLQTRSQEEIDENINTSLSRFDGQITLSLNLSDVKCAYNSDVPTWDSQGMI